MTGKIHNNILNILNKGIVRNILWLSVDKIFKLLIGLVVGALVARYLGPGNLGKVNYVLAFISIMSIVSNLGIDGFLVKELLEFPLEKNKFLGTSFRLRLLTVCLTTAVVTAIFFLLQLDREYFIIFFFLLFTVIITPFDLIDMEYQSKLQSKKTVISKNAAYVIGAVLKILMVYFKLPLIYFPAILGFEALLAAIFLVTQYQQKSGNILSWSFSWKTAGYILNKCWPFILSNVAVILYMRIDQIMLGNIAGSVAVGEFSAAVKVTEIFYFISLAFASSFLPSLINSNQENEVAFQHKLQLLYTILIAVAFLISAGVFLFSPLIISILYGPSYAASVSTLKIHIWTLLPAYIGVASSQYLVVKNMNQYNVYRTFLGLGINIVFNIFLIPAYGAKGAAISTVVAQVFAAIISNNFFKKTFILNKFLINSLKIQSFKALKL